MPVETLPLSGSCIITPAPDFLSQVRAVSLSASSELRVLSCTFDIASYQDGLFDVLGVACPAQVSGAVAKRKAEFLAGRYLCRLLLEAEGLPGQVAIGSQRQPMWPAGWLGAITHSTTSAMVALWPSHAGRVLGMDIESWIPIATAQSIESQITLPGELDGLGLSLPREHLLTLAFSAKESLYKALFARVGAFFDFHAAQLVEVDKVNSRFSLLLTQPLAGGFVAGDCFTGGYLAGPQQVLTWLADSHFPAGQ